MEQLGEQRVSQAAYGTTQSEQEAAEVSGEVPQASDMAQLFELAHKHDEADQPSASQRAFDTMSASSQSASSQDAASSQGGGFLGFGAGFNPYSYTDPKVDHHKLDPEVRKLHTQHVRMIIPVPVVTTGLLGKAGPDHEKQGLEQAKAKLHAHPHDVHLQKAVQAQEKQYAQDVSFVHSFEKTLELAGKHTTINLTLTGGTDYPERIDQFARVVRRLIHDGYTGLQLTLENEPNGFEKGHGFRGTFDRGIHGHDPALARKGALEYVHAYQRLNADLSDPHQGNVRGHVQIVGGDMVENYRKQFFTLITKLGLNKYVDAYSFHIYWGARPGGLQRALDDLLFVKHMAHQLAPGKALQVTEYGKEHRATAAEKAKNHLGVDGTEQGVVPAFEQGLFALSAVNDGYAGVVKWDAYYGFKNTRHVDPKTGKTIVDPRGNYGHFYMIGGPDQHYRPDASYQLMRAFTHAVEPGWRCQGTNHGTAGAEAQFRSADGHNGALLVMSTTARTVSTAGLPTHGPLYLTIWNSNGKGGLHMRVISPGDSVHVPAHGAIAVSTKPYA